MYVEKIELKNVIVGLNMVNENSQVWVKLTKNGAKILNKYWKDLNNRFKQLPRSKCNFKEDDVYDGQFYSVMDIFKENFCISRDLSFKEISFTELK